MKAAKTIKIVEEAQLAIRKNPPSDGRLKKWLNSYNQEDLPTTDETRWLAYFLLAARGYEFAHE